MKKILILIMTMFFSVGAQAASLGDFAKRLGEQIETFENTLAKAQDNDLGKKSGWHPTVFAMTFNLDIGVGQEEVATFTISPTVMLEWTPIETEAAAE